MCTYKYGQICVFTYNMMSQKKLHTHSNYTARAAAKYRLGSYWGHYKLHFKVSHNSCKFVIGTPVRLKMTLYIEF